MQCLSDRCEGDCIYLMAVKSPLSSALALITLGGVFKKMIKRAVLRVQVAVTHSTLKCPHFEVCQGRKWYAGQMKGLTTQCNHSVSQHIRQEAICYGIFESVDVREICPKDIIQLEGCNRLITHRLNSVNSCGYAEYSSLTSVQATCICMSITKNCFFPWFYDSTK